MTPLTTQPNEQHLKELLTRTGQGDSEAWGALWVAFAPAVRRWLCRRLRTHARDPRIEDLASETFARLPRAAAGFLGDSKVSTFVISIAKNVALEEHRKWTGQIELSDAIDEIHMAPLGDSSPAHDLELAALMQHAIDQLPPAQGAAVADRYLGGQELADGLNPRQSAARRQNLSRGCKRLGKSITTDPTYAPLAVILGAWIESSRSTNPPRYTRGA